MNFDVASELKVAGFPKRSSTITFDYLVSDTGIAYIPTLSELIEACGDGFRHLRQTPTAFECGDIVGTISNDDEWVSLSSGPTPEEAVARLWLALNKKV